MARSRPTKAPKCSGTARRSAWLPARCIRRLPENPWASPVWMSIAPCRARRSKSTIAAARSRLRLIRCRSMTRRNRNALRKADVGMPATPIISRPVYGTLSPQPGTHHLFVADAEGAAAILDMAKDAPAGFFDNAHVIFIPGDTGSRYVDALAGLKPAQFHQSPSFGSALPRLRQVLANAHMGIRLYLSGTEGLIGQAMLVASEAGIDHLSIQTEHRGSLARR